jgi:hypothetical protein
MVYAYPANGSLDELKDTPLGVAGGLGHERPSLR